MSFILDLYNFENCIGFQKKMSSSSKVMILIDAPIPDYSTTQKVKFYTIKGILYFFWNSKSSSKRESFILDLNIFENCIVFQKKQWVVVVVKWWYWSTRQFLIIQHKKWNSIHTLYNYTINRILYIEIQNLQKRESFILDLNNFLRIV